MKILFTAFVLLLSLSAVSAKADDIDLVREANLALSNKDYATAFARFSTLAEKGKPAAQFNLGAFYLNGQGVGKDEKLAFEWFGKSAAQGYSRAMQVIEKAAARGNAYAINELNVLKGPALPAVEVAPVPEKPREIAQEIPKAPLATKPEEKQPEPAQEKPRAKTASKTTRNALVYGAPAVAAPGKQMYGISVDVSRYQTKEPLYYPAGAVMGNVTQSYSVVQPGVSFWAAGGDYAVLVSYARRSGSMTAAVSGVGTLSKSYKTNSFGLDVRWLFRQYSSEHFMPYALAGVALDSSSGTADEIDFLDNYSRKDLLLVVGGGGIIPLDDNFGFRVEARAGADRQSSSGKYVPDAGVTLGFDSYSYTATALHTRIVASMYYRMPGGWNAQFGIARGSYAAGVVPAYSDMAINASVGYAYQ